MLSRFDDISARCQPDIRQILRTAGTKQCTVHLEVIPRDPQQKTYLDGEPRDGLENTIYPWGSLTKIVVASALSGIIDVYAISDRPEHERYKPLREAWDKPFVECFNKVSEVKMPNLLGEPTVGELVIHFSGIPPVNHIIMAPDGTPLMSKSDFPAVACQLTADTYGKPNSPRSRWEYSNGNTILIGLLIEAVSRKSLPEMVDELVFKQLGMQSAYMGTKPDNPNAAIPHEVSAEGAVPIIPPEALSDPLCMAAMGVHSNIHDMATFFRSIVETFPSEGTNPKPTLMASLLKRFADAGLEASYRYFPCGVYTTLDTTIPGSQSSNRMVSPHGESSNYTLGFEQPGKKPIEVYYHAGTINGFECCVYIIKRYRTLLIVQSNTSGYVDATDHISRLILQSLFVPDPHDSRYIEIPAMAELGAQDRTRLLAEFTQSQSASDDHSAIPSERLVGTYTHDKYCQTFRITEREDKLWVYWQGGKEIGGHPVLSQEMQLLRVNTQQVRVRVRYTVDRLHAWRDLDFMVIRDSNQQVTSLDRKDPNPPHNPIAFVRSS
ncbi:hypothetical protein FGG08_005073 [Glutinoglossum americanum]|uniref:Beta-lactamase-related domain-containing protein n=1 Tax=Glutinoglossum americanum TaxID=1670608 RepID=A0A9P8HV82_9PEZI|nr:hypothetical protein FGG08_005073 [Glutinoglossum americanum]